MELPQISIIVPIYNSERYIGRCIDSLINQTYSRLQILLIDDGSEDNSKSICDEYAQKDSRIIVLHQQNKGVSEARNSGLEYFEGEYCSFVDADDFVVPQYIEKLYNAAAGSHTLLAFCRSFDIGAVPEPRSLNTQEAKPEIIWRKDYDFLAYYAHRTVWGALYHRSIVKGIRFTKELSVGEDTLFFAEVLHHCEKSAFLNERLYYYVYYPSSLCHRKYDEKMYTEIIAWERVCRLFSDMPCRVKRSAEAALAFHCRQRIKQLAAENERNSPFLPKLIKIARRYLMSYMLSEKNRKSRCQYLLLCSLPAWYMRIYRKYKSSDSFLVSSLKQADMPECSKQEKGALISVVVPVYNVEQFLEQCLHSIVSQTYRNFELILIDDASADTSGKICDAWARADSRICVIHKEKNEGLSAARNTGVKASKGDYVCFIDSDDYVAENYLEILYDNAVTFRADVSYCHFQRVYEGVSDNAERDAGAPEKNIMQTKTKRELWLLLSNINNYRGTELVVAWNKLIKSSLARKLQFLPDKWHEDEFYINHLLEEAECFVETGARLYFYRQRPDSIMGKAQRLDPRHMDIIDAFEERVKLARKNAGYQAGNKMISAYRGTILMQYAVFDKGENAVRLRKRLFKSFFKYPGIENIRQTVKYILFFLHLWNP